MDDQKQDAAVEYLVRAEERARMYSGLGIQHEGDCAGSLCPSCGHCIHSLDACSCSSCGCLDAVDDDEVLIKRDVLRMVAALRAALAQHVPVMDNKGWLPAPVAWCSCNPLRVVRYPCPTVVAITAVLDGPR